MSSSDFEARRRALRQLVGGALLACPICASLGATFGSSAARAAEGHGKKHWSYEGAEGPEHWGGLSADFKSCDLGMQQSPIDLTAAVRAEVGTVVPSFQEMPLTILNNGHTIQVNCAEGSYSSINGGRYDLLQFHFHHPSEHLVDGKHFDMEMHFVHRNEAGNLAVLGVMMTPGQENQALAPIWEVLPAQPKEAETLGRSINPAALLPREASYFRYQGSLTTPPCSEGVLWTVYKQPIAVSTAQVKKFADIFAMNARPAQPVHRRFLLEAS